MTRKRRRRKVRAFGGPLNDLQIRHMLGTSGRVSQATFRRAFGARGVRVAVLNPGRRSIMAKRRRVKRRRARARRPLAGFVFINPRKAFRKGSVARDLFSGVPADAVESAKRTEKELTRAQLKKGTRKGAKSTAQGRKAAQTAKKAATAAVAAAKPAVNLLTGGASSPLFTDVFGTGFGKHAKAAQRAALDPFGTGFSKTQLAGLRADVDPFGTGFTKDQIAAQKRAGTWRPWMKRRRVTKAKAKKIAKAATKAKAAAKKAKTAATRAVKAAKQAVQSKAPAAVKQKAKRAAVKAVKVAEVAKATAQVVKKVATRAKAAAKKAPQIPTLAERRAASFPYESVSRFRGQKFLLLKGPNGQPYNTAQTSKRWDERLQKWTERSYPSHVPGPGRLHSKGKKAAARKPKAKKGRKAKARKTNKAKAARTRRVRVKSFTRSTPKYRRDSVMVKRAGKRGRKVRAVTVMMNPSIGSVKAIVKNTVATAVPALAGGAVMGLIDAKLLAKQHIGVRIVGKLAAAGLAGVLMKKYPRSAAVFMGSMLGTLGYEILTRVMGGFVAPSKEIVQGAIGALVREDPYAIQGLIDASGVPFPTRPSLAGTQHWDTIQTAGG